VDLRRYVTYQIVDLMELLYGQGYFPGPKARSLKAVAAMYGIENKFPGVEGDQVGEMDDTLLEAYCANDVRMTLELARRTQGYYWE
jgi:hypothetical protein